MKTENATKAASSYLKKLKKKFVEGLGIYHGKFTLISKLCDYLIKILQPLQGINPGIYLALRAVSQLKVVVESIRKAAPPLSPTEAQVELSKLEEKKKSGEKVSKKTMKQLRNLIAASDPSGTSLSGVPGGVPGGIPGEDDEYFNELRKNLEKLVDIIQGKQFVKQTKGLSKNAC